MIWREGTFVVDADELGDRVFEMGLGGVASCPGSVTGVAEVVVVVVSLDDMGCWVSVGDPPPPPPTVSKQGRNDEPHRCEE